MNKKNGKISILTNTVIVCCIALFLSSIIIFFKQDINDQITVWSYKPSDSVLTLAQRAGFSDDGLFLYLASQPSIEGTQLFNYECDNVENVESILGCYKDGKIFIYDVSDERLDGIKEVTAAHETLHAVYSRLGQKELNRVNMLLNLEYEKVKDNADFKLRMDFYERTEPDQIDNELHSVIGTEVTDIGQELEEYYSRYFIDRQQIVNLNKKYVKVFTDLGAGAKEIFETRNSLIQSIDERTVRYNQDIQSLDSDIKDFNYRANNAMFESQEQFNYERSQLVVRKSSLGSAREGISKDIDQSNILLTQYNSIATETKKLFDTLDSSLAPLPSI